MRILLTGAAGFLGSHLLRALIARGHTVAALLRSTSDRERIADCAGQYRPIEGSLANLASARAMIHQFAPEALAHLAWGGVGNAARNDAAQFANIEQTYALVQMAIEAGAQQVLALGSQAEYGPQVDPITESTPTQPTTLYGVAKLASCHATRQQCIAAEARFAWLRVFSTYGPGDAPHWMIPSMIERLLRREHMSLTPGEQLWDYLYAEDAARAMTSVLESPTAEGVFNLGSGQPQTIRAIAAQLRDLVDPSLPLGFGEVPYRPDQVMRLEANIERLRAATGWRPTVSLADGLQRTVSWHRAQHQVSSRARVA